MARVIFYSFAALLIGSALIAVTIRDIVRAIFMFFVVLLTLAGLYVFVMADFIAVAQVIIYAGGVLVLMLFAFLLSGKDLLAEQKPQRKFISLHAVPAIFIAVTFLFIIISVILSARVDSAAWINATGKQIAASDNTVHLIGISMMTRYILPFEIISIFLMMALIGAAHMSRKEGKGP